MRLGIKKIGEVLHIRQKDASRVSAFLTRGGLSPVLYHATEHGNAQKILEEDSFRLATNLGVKADQKGAAKKHFYLSCSRVKYGGYQRSLRTGVVFVLDGEKLAQNYSGTSVDYWGEEWRKSASGDDYLRYDENEDRVITDKPEIKPASRYIREVHVLTVTKEELEARYAPYVMAAARRIALEAAKRQIPCFLYDEAAAWKAQNKAKAKAKPYGELAGAELKAETEGKSFYWYSESDIKLFLEVLHARSWDQVSKKARESFRYFWTDNDFEGRLENILHNSRKQTDNHPWVAKLTAEMKKHKATNIQDFAKVLCERWRALLNDRDSK